MRRIMWAWPLVTLGCGSASDVEPQSCEQSASIALQTCLAEVAEDLLACHEQDGAPCQATDETLQRLDGAVREVCTDGELAGLDLDAATERLEVACASQAEAVGWRFYGGPQAEMWEAGISLGCLSTSHGIASDLLIDSLTEIADCSATDCDLEGLAQRRGALEDAAATAIETACPGGIASLVGQPGTILAQRISEQADCTAATVHPGDLGLQCGPSYASFEAARGEWTEIVLDSETWGTLCGDGSDYAFWVNLAPEGQPLDRIFIGLEGGGVCLFEDDCVPRFESSPELFTALDGRPEGGGIGSDDPAMSEFANWTRVYLPYCNQDVFAGGGVVEDLGSLQLPRYGSVNLRTSLRMVRDVVWRELDNAGGDGFRPDRVQALFGGWSAGAYGTMYNYPFLVDELLWPRSTGFPDAGMALHNGELLGVRNLGLAKIPAWNMGPLLPPYCFAPECAEGPHLLRKASPRLLQVPEQQILTVTNPKDDIQQNDAFFSDEAFWINTMRTEVCDLRDLPGLQFYLTSISDESVHVVTIRDELWEGSVDGVVMRDWFSRAVSDPASISDRMEEANFVQDIPGVEPFPCAVAP